MQLEHTNEFEKVKAAYIDVISNTPDFAEHCRWEYGKHPSDEVLRAYIRNGEMYVLKDNGEIAGMVAITMYQGTDYETVSWAEALENDQVAVLHLLAVPPAFQGRSLGAAMITDALALAKNAGKKALRLDTLKTNRPAQHMYEKAGFSMRGEQCIFMENRGWFNFLYYEKEL